MNSSISSLISSPAKRSSPTLRGRYAIIDHLSIYRFIDLLIKEHMQHRDHHNSTSSSIVDTSFVSATPATASVGADGQLQYFVQLPAANAGNVGNVGGLHTITLPSGGSVGTVGSINQTPVQLQNGQIVQATPIGRLSTNQKRPFPFFLPVRFEYRHL